MNIFLQFFLQNFSKLFAKVHQIAPFKKKFLGEHASKPPLASACRKNILNTPEITS